MWLIVTDYASSPAKQFNQCDSAYSWDESFEKTFETNSIENLHKLQKLEDAKVNQKLQKAIDQWSVINDHVWQLDKLG